jgi:hypothetical protein
MAFATHGYAREEKSSEVKISWEEFKKLLNLDADEVSLTWEEFRQLIAQTGEENTIPYTVKNGKITLPREQFKQLLNKMKPPRVSVLKPPADYIITKAEYSGQLDNKTAAITVRFFLEIFEKESRDYRKIPFLPQSVAIEEVLLDGKPGLVMEQNGWYYITTAEKGRHVLTVKYYTPCNLEKGSQILNINIPRTAITLFDLIVPLENVDIEIPNAKELLISQKKKNTRITAILPATDYIKVLAHRKYISTKTVAEETPAKIYAETVNLLSIEEDAIRVNCRIKLNVLQNTINHIKIKIPDKYTILYIHKSNGTRLRDWKTIKTENNGQILDVPFNSPLDGSIVFNIFAERLFESEKTEIDFNGFQIIGAIRETGYIGAEKKSTAEATPTKVEKLDRIDIKDLPNELINMSKRPLLFGFRYLRHPHRIFMTVTKHKELPSISTVIDMASVITVILDDGKMLTKAVFTIRNTYKQFLGLELPSGSKIWTVYVAGKRENASKIKDKILIPLSRSSMKDNILQSFTVDLIYYGKGDSLNFAGSQNIYFPKTDVMISKMIWSVYLPRNYNYLHFSGNVEKEEMASTLNLILGKTRGFSLDKAKTYYDVGINIEKEPQYQRQMSDYEQSLQSVFKNQSIRQKDIAVQMQNEANLETIIKQEKSKGLGMPGSSAETLKIELPTSGQIYRFNKTVIEGESITLYSYYISRSVMTIIKIVVILIILLFVYLLRKKIKNLFYRIYEWAGNQEKFWSFIKTRTGLRLTLFIAALCFIFISHIIFTVLALLFIMAVFKPNWLVPKISGEQQESPKNPGDNRGSSES